MIDGNAVGLLVGAVVLGAIHGVEPGHGWPVAASYALGQTNKWVYGFAASLILGVGHLISSIAMVGAFFYAKAYFNLTQVNEPLSVLGGIQIGGPVSLVAGVLLIALGIREYRHGHSHEHGQSDSDDHVHHGQSDGGRRAHQHEHHEHESTPHHTHDDSHRADRPHADGGLVARVKAAIPFTGGHSHTHGNPDDVDRGLFGIAWFAFLLGFAHEEEFEIIALCAGSDYCLALMSAYALTVIAGIVGLTMLFIAGYEQYEETVEKYTPYLPVFSAAVLVIMGTGFITGLF